MFPIFKSHYSIGKSILTLEPPSQDRNGGPDSVFDIVESLEDDKLVLVEDTFMGFLQGQKMCESLGLKFIFGLRIDIIDESFDPELKKIPKHKLIVFSKNANGCKILFKIYTELKSSDHEAINLSLLRSLWDKESLELAVPFYDSFLFSNLFLFNSFVVDLSYFEPKFLIEYNGLPFDIILNESVANYCGANSFESLNCKSIFYKNRADFDSYVTYKLICSRGSFSSNKSSLEKPNFDHMGSREFCYESFLEQK